MKIQRKESGGSGETEIFEALFRRRPFLAFSDRRKSKTDFAAAEKGA